MRAKAYEEVLAMEFPGFSGELEGDVKRHTMRRLESFIDAIVGKRLTYAALIAKVGA